MPEEIHKTIEPISRRIKISGLSLASSQAPENIMVSFIIIDTPQQFSGTIVISKVEVKKLNITVGDELNLTMAALEQ